LVEQRAPPTWRLYNFHKTFHRISDVLEHVETQNVEKRALFIYLF